MICRLTSVSMVSVTIPALTRLLCPIRWHRCRPFQPRLPLNAVGRSFGDFLLKAELNKPQWKQVGHPLKKRWTLSCQVISPVPQIEQYKLQPGWEFILVATDGVAPSLSWSWWCCWQCWRCCSRCGTRCQAATRCSMFVPSCSRVDIVTSCHSARSVLLMMMMGWSY